MSPNDSITVFYITNRKTTAKIKIYCISVIVNCAKYTAEAPGDTRSNGAYNAFTLFMFIPMVRQNMVLEKTQFTINKLQNTETYTLTPNIFNT